MVSSGEYMKKFAEKISWQHYLTTVIISTVCYLISHYYRNITGPFGYAFGYGGIAFVLMLLLVFVTALMLGVKDAYFKCLYPFFASAFIWFVPPFLFLLLNRSDPRINAYYFGYYAVFGLVFVFFVLLIVAFLGLGIGVLLRKRGIV